jgi:hypothetical protein
MDINSPFVVVSVIVAVFLVCILWATQGGKEEGHHPSEA